MRIVVHMGTLHGRGSGSVASGLLPALVSHGQRHEFLAIVPPGLPLPEPVKNLTLVRRRLPPSRKLWFENVTLRRLLAAWDADVLLSMGDTSLPFARIPHLLTVQQAYLAVRPRDLDFTVPTSLSLKLRVMRAYFRLGLGSVSQIAVQTIDMRDRLVDRWGLESRKVIVVPSAVDERFDHYCWKPDREEPYICYVADPLPHKNHEILPGIMAMLSQAHPRVRLKLTVYPEDVQGLMREAERAGLLDRLDLVGALAPAQVKELYRHALALVMPSRLESFCLPLYEAMAIGCPVVTSDAAFAREACGDAGLIAHDEPGEYFLQLDRLIRDDDFSTAISKELRRRFDAVGATWTDVATRYIEALESLGQSPTKP